MANETELANIAHQTDILAGIATEAFVQFDPVFPLINTEVFPDNTNVIKFAHKGKYEAAAGTESTAYTYGADSERSDTTTTVTGVRKEVSTKITLEAARFAGPLQTLESEVRMLTAAVARLAASDLKTLFSSVSGAVTATSIFTKDDLLDSRYTVNSSVKNAGVSQKLVGMFDYKAMNEFTKEITDTSASAFVSQVDLNNLGIARAGTPKFDMFDVVGFETDGLPTSASDDVACVWDPRNAFVAGIDGNNAFQFTVNGPFAASPWIEIYMWTFWHIAEHNDSAAVRLLSDT